MFGGSRVTNDARIGNNSNGNTLIVGSQLTDNTILVSDPSRILDIIAQTGRYDMVQHQVAKFLEEAKRTHPLYPEFSAEYNSKLGRLVSTPETADAFRNHPKRIKGTYRLDYSRYPYMDKSETPWAYAYRTQTSVEMDTTSYQEFLGDIDDPFPLLTFSEGMKTTICAPEFPEAVEATIISGDVSVFFQLRRLPCMEYGWVTFGNVSKNHGFDIRIKASEADSKTTVTFKKIPSAPWEIQLLRESLFISMAKTRKMRITVAGKTFLALNLSEQDVKTELFTAANIISHHIENLLAIEKYTGCKFSVSSISDESYVTAQMLVASIKGELYPIKGKYEDRVRTDYDRIAEELLMNPDDGKITSETTVMRISLYDQLFTAERALAMYADARISNLGEVKRSVRKKRKNIRVVIKPQEGKDYFLKWVRFDGLRRLIDVDGSGT